MPNYNFLNIHVLISHSPSCLNRDDSNMQKSAIFGGVRRVRISSQSLKRAIRKSDAYAERLGAPSDRTNRLDRLTLKYCDALKESFSPAQVERTIRLIALDAKEDAAPAADAKAEEKKQAVAPWSVAEVAKICELIHAPDAEGLDDKKLKKKLGESEIIRQVRHALKSSVDVALSGRMATSGVMMTVDGAASVAHAITTHAVDADIDWFTAVDDLVIDAGEVGAGHLNTQEFGAGVFYRYASVNIGQLQTNIGDASRTDALDIAAHFVHLLATVVPQAKQRTFAAYNLADVVAVSFGDLPVSAANAFETPVKRERNGGFLKPSIEAFQNYLKNVRTGYGLREDFVAFSLWETTLAPRLETLEALENWVRSDGQEVSNA